ncbi:MAG: hypothetical protein K0S33_3097 [Bacteroidetes bacterium]|jgi:hypothetical protein|nr:hypothetical protein [Bacteroidota bacterium]
MIPLSEFLEMNPFKKRVGSFDEQELSGLEGKIPAELLEFLRQEQRSVYGDDFFRTELPADFHDILNQWGLDGKNAYVFLRSSFGCLAYFYNNDFYVLNPQEGINTILGDNSVDLLFNLSLAYSGNLEEGFFYDVHSRHKANLPDLQPDEMYTLVPPVTAYGDRETSKVELVNMKTELLRLARSFGKKTTD